ncbi:hypothetical protein GOODEAATRI_006766 [Goodea atripinnis]|uniref:Uncharacterized protein n=1 Tax=Goodea atripinnis TaxID=208336 RepID=A0ABV0NJ43_9TELE
MTLTSESAAVCLLFYGNVTIVLASSHGLAPHFFGTAPSLRTASAVFTDLHKAPDVISLIAFCRTTPGCTKSLLLLSMRQEKRRHSTPLWESICSSVFSSDHVSAAHLGSGLFFMINTLLIIVLTLFVSQVVVYLGECTCTNQDTISTRGVQPLLR